jgi:hypothetical protein
MAGSPQSRSMEPDFAWELRLKYRCTMCHKQCLVPCQFTAAEFRRMVAAGEDGTLVDGSEGDDPEV